MKIINTPLDGAYIIEQPRHYDDRGYFLESYNKRDFAEIGLDVEFVQDNHSSSTEMYFVVFTIR